MPVLTRSQSKLIGSKQNQINLYVMDKSKNKGNKGKGKDNSKKYVSELEQYVFKLEQELKQEQEQKQQQQITWDWFMTNLKKYCNMITNNTEERSNSIKNLPSYLQLWYDVLRLSIEMYEFINTYGYDIFKTRHNTQKLSLVIYKKTYEIYGEVNAEIIKNTKLVKMCKSEKEHLKLLKLLLEAFQKTETLFSKFISFDTEDTISMQRGIQISKKKIIQYINDLHEYIENENENKKIEPVTTVEEQEPVTTVEEPKQVTTIEEPVRKSKRNKKVVSYVGMDTIESECEYDGITDIWYDITIHFDEDYNPNNLADKMQVLLDNIYDKNYYEYVVNEFYKCCK